MNTGEIIIYQTADGQTQLDVRMENDTVWINRQQMAELFGRDIKTIGKHINNALRDELTDIPVVANFATTASDGKTYQVDHYNLDMIISVGYRVKSQRGTQFRIWANRVLREYLVKGYALNQNAKVEQLEEFKQAAMLLYLVTKNHSFSDGNKRIAAFLFLWFMEKNGILYKSDGSMLLGNNTLVALTLMIAESRTEEKDVMVKVVVNLINKNNYCCPVKLFVA